jgi:hypothetical protein
MKFLISHSASWETTSKQSVLLMGSWNVADVKIGQE